MPKPGDIAICHNNYIGMITDEKQIFVEEIESSYVLYKGIHLSKDKLGKVWLSKQPRVIGNIFDLIKDLKKNEE